MNHLAKRKLLLGCLIAAFAALAVWAVLFFRTAAVNHSDGRAGKGTSRADGKESIDGASASARTVHEAAPVTKKDALSAYRNLPLRFEANAGQADAQVKFLARGAGYNLFLTPDEAVLVLSNRNDARTGPGDDDSRTGPAGKGEGGRGGTTAVVRMTLVNGAADARVTGGGQQGGTSNYYIGSDPTKWRVGVPAYSEVRYENVYQGVDVVYYGKQGLLEYDFIVAPGADPGQIRIAFEGTEPVRVNKDGDLVLDTPAGEVYQHKPVAYQNSDGVRREVAGSYVVTDAQQVGFQLGEYDTSRPLVIDPAIGYSTYLGGSVGDSCTDIAVDAEGHALVTGTATSPDFPVKNAYQSARGDQRYEDAFVTKLSPDGSSVVYSTFLGGEFGDDGYSIAVDHYGAAYVTGPTSSFNYPIQSAGSGVAQGSHAGSYPGPQDHQNTDAFVTKLSSSGSLVYSTFVGGSYDDNSHAIVVDGLGRAYITGRTNSGDLHTTGNAFQPSATRNASYSAATSSPYNEFNEAFVAKLSPDGSALLYYSYLGGNSFDNGRDIAIDGNNHIYITGHTLSSNLPTTAGALFPARTGDSFDGLLAEFNTELSGAASLVTSSYLGGRDYGTVTVDQRFNIFVSGGDTANALGNVVTKLAPHATSLLWSQTVGGTDFNKIWLVDLVSDGGGNIYAAGWRNIFGNYGPGDVAVLKLRSKDGKVTYSKYLGGSDSSGRGIALDTGGNVYVAGGTASKTFLTTPDAFQRTNRSTSAWNPGQGFVAKLPNERPLIFIPGIGGSYLDFRALTEFKAVDGYINLWPGALFGVLGDERKSLSLDPDDIESSASLEPRDAIRTYIAPEWLRRLGTYGGVGAVFKDVTFYGPLIDVLTDPEQGGYVEYDVDKRVERRTTSGCDFEAQQENRPTLFVFAYDWRKSNAYNAQKLKDYVGCVQTFYPDTEIDLLTHSMGSLLARRYILDNPDTHSVNKHIALGAPWLGAPGAIASLETGESNIPTRLVAQQTLKRLAEFYPGLHELLPSRWYYELVSGSPYADFGGPFGESEWDLNRNGYDTELYTYDQQVDVLDYLHPRSLPGGAGKSFHEAYNFGQDNWSQDDSGVNYHVMYGTQKQADTLGFVLAYSSGLTCNEVDCWRFGSYITGNVRGDGTVPTPSLERRGNLPNSLQPFARWWHFVSPSEGEDYKYEHTGLAQNTLVQQSILYALGRGPRPNVYEVLPPQQPGVSVNTNLYPVPPPSPSKFLTVRGVEHVGVADFAGNNNHAYPETFAGFPFPVPNVNYFQLGPRTVMVTMPTSQSYEISFRTPANPVSVELVTGLSNREPTSAARFADLSLPAGVAAKMTVSPGGGENLLLDQDGNGTFETVIAPGTSVSGPAALDVTPPAISFAEAEQGASAVVTITAQDGGAGVKFVKYSLDGVSFHPYAGPLTLNPALTPVVYAFADDNVGNRSSVAEYRLKTRSKIAFTGRRAGNAELYVMNADGTGQTSISNNPNQDESPAWSPDGTKLAFASDRDDPSGAYEIYLMNADGSGQLRLTDLPGSSHDPLWSPDGSKVAFLNQANGVDDLYVIDADGSNPSRLTHGSAATFDWAPGGGKLAFDTGVGAGGDVYVVNPDGSGLTNLTGDSAGDYHPRWSPDGLRIAFASERNGNPEIFVMKADGSGQTRLTNNPVAGGPVKDYQPSWSPEGSMLAFNRVTGDSSYRLYVMGSDGTRARSVGEVSSVFNFSPLKWSPDGTKIASSGILGGNLEVFLVTPHGGGTTRLTTNSSADTSPAWQPANGLLASDLEVKVSHAGDFVAGETGTYHVTVTNRGITASAGAIKVTDVLPAGLSLVSWNGAGWSCDAAGQTVTCSSGAALPRGASKSYALTVAVSTSAGASVVNDVRLSNESDVNFNNNYASDLTLITHPSIKGRVTDGVGVGMGGVTVTLSGPQSAAVTTNHDGYYIFSGLVRGANYTVTPSPAGQPFIPASRSFNAISGDNTADFTQPAPVAAGNILISEFRVRGPAPASGGDGSLDEFVELYNNTASPVTVWAADGSAGWAVVASDGVTRFIIPNGVTIPARGHFLGVNSQGYSLSAHPGGAGATATGDISYALDIPDGAGIALFKTADPNAFSLANRLDAVGFSMMADPLFREGSGLADVGSDGGQYSFTRKMGTLTGGFPQDSDNNGVDFLFVSTTAGTFNGITSALGAPGPENLSSPVYYVGVLLNLLDPNVSSSTAPNRARDTTPVTNGPKGTLTIRRTMTNTTGAPMTRLRFRVVDMTTLNYRDSTQADTRVLSSSNVTVTRSDGSPVQVLGTTVETPPDQPIGGGMFTTLTVALANGVLQPGETINVQFVVGVHQGGGFRFYVNVEALP